MQQKVIFTYFVAFQPKKLIFLFVIMFQGLFASTKNEPLFLGRLELRPWKFHLLGFGWELLALHNLHTIVADGPTTVFIPEE